MSKLQVTRGARGRALFPPLLALALAGCANTMPGPQTGRPDGAGPAGMHGHMHTDDMQAMCERHRKEMTGKTPAEQKRLMDEHMQSMTPEMRERARRMHEQCQPS